MTAYRIAAAFADSQSKLNQNLVPTPDMTPAATAICLSDSFRNVWRTLRQEKRIHVNRIRETIREAQGKDVPETPPPTYTEVSSQGRSGYPLHNSTCRRTMPIYLSAVHYPDLAHIVKTKNYDPALLCWLLVEIMAVTFYADFQRLQAAIAKSHPSWTELGEDPFSILTLGQTLVLEELCALVRDLEEKLRRNRWPSVRQQDKDLLIKLVLEPAKKLGIDPDYALEVLGRYRHVEYRGGLKTKTLVDDWTPTCPRIRPRWTSPMLDLGDTLASHASLMTPLLEEEQSLVLNDAMATFQKNKGLEELQNSKELQNESLTGSGEMCCWPLSDNYMNLGKALRENKMNDDVEQTRKRLRKRRNLRSYFLFV